MAIVFRSNLGSHRQRLSCCWFNGVLTTQPRLTGPAVPVAVVPAPIAGLCLVGGRQADGTRSITVWGRRNVLQGRRQRPRAYQRYSGQQRHSGNCDHYQNLEPAINSIDGGRTLVAPGSRLQAGLWAARPLLGTITALVHLPFFGQFAHAVSCRVLLST